MNAAPNNDLLKHDVMTVPFFTAYVLFSFMYYLFDKNFLFMKGSIGIAISCINGILGSTNITTRKLFYLLKSHFY